MPDLTPELILRAYAMGLFPMAESATSGAVHWVDPQRRGVIPLTGFHISRSLRHHLLHARYQVTVNADFAGVMRACADRSETWINAEILEVFQALHRRGQAHSLEVWQDGVLAGGVYGLAIGGAFFGESMFSTRTNGSKTALAWAVHRLRAGGFVLFDTQFLTTHLASLGAVEIPRAAYHQRLAAALPVPATFAPPGYQPSVASVAAGSSSTVGTAPSGSTQPRTQTS